MPTSKTVVNTAKTARKLPPQLPQKNLAAAALGARGGAIGSKFTEARKLASAANGKSGGRPTAEERQKRIAAIQDAVICTECGRGLRKACVDDSGLPIAPHSSRVLAFKWQQKVIEVQGSVACPRMGCKAGLGVACRGEDGSIIVPHIERVRAHKQQLHDAAHTA